MVSAGRPINVLSMRTAQPDRNFLPTKMRGGGAADRPLVSVPSEQSMQPEFPCEWTTGTARPAAAAATARRAAPSAPATGGAGPVIVAARSPEEHSRNRTVDVLDR